MLDVADLPRPVANLDAPELVPVQKFSGFNSAASSVPKSEKVKPEFPPSSP